VARKKKNAGRGGEGGGRETSRGSGVAGKKKSKKGKKD